jgi:hypothetical protein
MPVDVKKIRDEIEGGLTNSRDLRKDAYDNFRFARAHFEEYPTKSRDGRYQSLATRRTSPVFMRLVAILTSLLYKNQPTRKLSDEWATEWLAKVYKRNAMWAKWKGADELSIIGGFAGMQFAGDEDPLAPVKISQWRAHDMLVWSDADDPTVPDAVAVIDMYDGQRRLRLWTRDTIFTYETEKGVDHVARGGTAWKYKGRKDNPYRRVKDPLYDESEEGIIPFCFTHWYYPTVEFEQDGPGNAIRQLNEWVNGAVDSLGDRICYQGNPIGVAQGVAANWRPPAQIKPGDFLNLSAEQVDAAGNGPMPTLFYLAPELGFIDATWLDLNNFLDHALEMHGIPPSLIRMVQTGARSGLAIQAEQLPLLAWVEGRRGMWSDYEEQAARMALLVGESHLRTHGHEKDAGLLQAALEDWEFSIHWPTLYTQLPGPEKDAADDWRLERAMASKVQILMEREQLTEQEAFEALAKIADQNAQLQAMGIDPSIPPTGGGGFGQQPNMFTGEGPMQGAAAAQGQQGGPNPEVVPNP